MSEQEGIPRDCCVCGATDGLEWVVYRTISRILGHESGDWMCAAHAAEHRVAVGREEAS